MPLTTSADVLFAQYKEQNYLERLHRPWTTPLAVRPVFLKSPRRVEALVGLLHIALQTHQLRERLYRQSLPANAQLVERRGTADTLRRAFRVLVRHRVNGEVITATAPPTRQREILHRLGFPTPAQTVVRTLSPVPTD